MNGPAERLRRISDAIARLNEKTQFNELGIHYLDNPRLRAVEAWLHEAGHALGLFRMPLRSLGDNGSHAIGRKLNTMRSLEADMNEARAISVEVVASRLLELNFDPKKLVKSATTNRMRERELTRIVLHQIEYSPTTQRYARHIVAQIWKAQ